ncbi:MAG: leucine-rich repeat protein, partial [Prolixibacteraceae bacterium]|nr:leucine-rich repeat protein [Prolixibacteraceae bacterium]
MKSTLPTILLFLCLYISNYLSAQTISADFAKKIAQNHLASVGGNSLKSAGPNKVKTQFTSYSVTSTRKDTLYFVLNDTINHTFVIVAADKRSTPIIGYSLDGNYSSNNQPPAFVEWMENRKKELEYIKDNNIKADSKITEQWEKLSKASSNDATGNTSVEPLIQTKWGQGCYYNALCPADEAGSCGHTLTGCVATSMAQIMKYWNYPTRGVGSHSYLCAGYGLLSADFGATTYHWKEMPDVVTSSNNAVATLMRHCGIALEMRYGTKSSGALGPRNEFVDYFNYSSDAEVVDRRFFTSKDWANLLKSELNLQRPIWYNGAENSCAESHAFICDGYQNSYYFHFNWGWGGLWDGYFYLESLNPGGLSYTAVQNAIIKLFPAKLPDEYKGIILSAKTVGIKNEGGSARITINSSEDWNALSDQTWLTVNPQSGNKGSHTMIFTASANPTTSTRKATVTISGQGLNNKTIEVLQFGAFEVTSGNLKTVLGDQLSIVTSLKLTGTIDARDFRTMRDEMPALTEIDLSRVTITSYTGTEGTIFQNYTYPSNAIPDFAFLLPLTNQAKTSLKSLIFPPSLKSIGNYAFEYCKNLNIETLPYAVTFIGDIAFGECSSLESFVLPSTITHIGRFAFQNFKGAINVDPNNSNYSSLDGILFNKSQTELIQCPTTKSGTYSIPSSVKTIGLHAFENCKNLKAISIPSSVTFIEAFAFNGCKGLTNINIPESVTSIGQRAFGGLNCTITVDSNNSYFSSNDGVLFNKSQTELIQCPVSKTGGYTIPPTVLALKEEAFHSCKNISTLSIPPSVKCIESFAIYCKGLSSIYNYRVTPITFEQTSFPMTDIDKATCVLHVPFGTKALYEMTNQWKDFLHISEMPGIFLTEKSVGFGIKGGIINTKISTNVAFTANSDQQWLTISMANVKKGINTISLSATPNPTSLIRRATVTLLTEGYASQSIDIIQYGIVETTAGNLKSILGSNLSTIKSLTLSGVIDARDFKTMRDEMHELADLDLSNVTIVEYTGTEGTADTSRVYYPANSIPSGAFDKSKDGRGNLILNSVIIPPSVTMIGNYAFSYCFGLTEFTIPSMVSYIGVKAFNRCKGINAIHIPASVTNIDVSAFGEFSGLITVDTNNRYYSAIDGVLFNKTQTEIVLCPVSKTGSFIIPESVKTIHEQAFSWCEKLSEIAVPPMVTSIEEGAFSYCFGLESINIPLSVVSIGRSAFIYCGQLRTIEIPKSTNFIGGWAFSGCSSLKTIYAHPAYPINLVNSTDVFSSMDNSSCTLFVPYGSKVRYQSAPQWKDFENIVENKLPTANAGPDQAIDEKSQVTLNGSNSNDSEKSELTFFWSAPSGIILSSNSVAQPTFIAPDVKEDTKYTFSLTVNDGWNNSTVDQVIITVKNIDKAPYLKNPVSNISVDKRAPDQIIDLKSVFMDDDAS